ncbi:hypothetical protein CSOJ01_14479 [Colletotrichum sojae]|uniref:F-box domain-containing protein n=1 Tax=Colletotrichum sojae TaxID=2175907 RepID=A0A8H6IQI9_9PEZI|nr:hypothetical protein CSOJ01_14479 [Colletotrichum sojae]
MEATSQFESLPTEVLIQILASILDIHCLWTLLTASPASYRVFNRYSDEIFWPSISDGVLPTQTQELVRFLLHLRAGAFQKTRLGDVTRKIKDREAGIVLGTCKGGVLGYDFPTMDPSKEPSLEVMRAIIAVAGRIRCLSGACIDYYIERVTSVRAEGRAGESLSFEIVTPPSWVEEQRVIRAFWRIQLIHELKLAAREDRILRSAAAAEEEDGLDAGSFYDSSISNLKAAHHEVMTAIEFLRDSPALADWKHNSDQLPPPTGPARYSPPSTLRMPSSSALRQSSLVMPTDGLWIVDSMSRGAHSPIKYAGFEPYRALGFAIWDRQSLADMGLASPPGHGRVTGLGSYFSCWLRLLSPSDLVLAEECMREAESQGGRLGPLQPMIQDNAS